MDVVDVVDGWLKSEILKGTSVMAVTVNVQTRCRREQKTKLKSFVSQIHLALLLTGLAAALHKVEDAPGVIFSSYFS